MKKYNYLIVGAGLYGCVFASEMKRRGKNCLVIDRRDHVGGNVYTKEVEGINVHVYGAHIFHTHDKEIWDYINNFAEFNNYINSPVAIYKDELYNLPFNMNTFSKMWNIKTPYEAKAIIEAQVSKEKVDNPSNLEEQAISLVGRDVYEKLVKGYTEKQWGMECSKLSASIIKRLPLRFTYDNNYFTDRYQGIPIGGYTAIIDKMLDGIDIRLNTDYLTNRAELDELAEKIVYTGALDEFYDYKFGALGYRRVEFEQEILDIENYQGNAVVNYTAADIPYTRIIEHKHFEYNNSPKTVISKEYPRTWKQGDEPYYPINDEESRQKFAKYKELADKEENIIFGGRLGEYKYYDMDDVIRSALDRAALEN